MLDTASKKCPRCGHDMKSGSLESGGFGMAFCNGIQDYNVRTSLAMFGRFFTRRCLVLSTRVKTLHCRNCREVSIKY